MPLGTQLKTFASKLLPSGSLISSALARWSTRLSRLAVIGAMAVAIFDRPPQKPHDRNVAPTIEILRTRPVPIDMQKHPQRPPPGH